jgi:hypothetical protein
MLVTIVRLGLLVSVGAGPSRRLRAGVSSVTVAAKLAWRALRRRR